MGTHSFYTRQMLSHYGRQLVSARRLARYEQLIGKQMPADDAIAVRRKMVVERISREVIDNLIFSGSDNPVVSEIRKKLDDWFGCSLFFQYPPGELTFQIFKIEPDGVKLELKGAEKQSVMDKLWELTLVTVNETML